MLQHWIFRIAEVIIAVSYHILCELQHIIAFIHTCISMDPHQEQRIFTFRDHQTCVISGVILRNHDIRHITGIVDFAVLVDSILPAEK